MSKKSAFEGLFDERMDQMPRPAERNESSSANRPAAAATNSKAGRAPGKRSDPAWKQHTVMLRKENHIAACEILRRQENGKDISELLDSLLEGWVKKQRVST
jgi:hypothetical protein